ncbi:hypothetical protein [Moritella sp. 28]|uniref:hypothetical protein n=1 Tax=Moritella sp. 28 TaxID=2746232 RepID=UPI001BA7B9EE|nr:hypothetical protein [Moritella sp. 28]QUM86992.1 hypothetical protein HWV02_22180 [Moritella sp. 28]
MAHILEKKVSAPSSESAQDFIVKMNDGEADRKFSGKLITEVNPEGTGTHYQIFSGENKDFVVIKHGHRECTIARVKSEEEVIIFFGYDSSAKQLYIQAGIDAAMVI